MHAQADLTRKKLRRPHRRLLSTQVAEILREEILSGRFHAGQRLIEEQLCEELGVSRGPLREALSELEKSGLVYSEPHRGSFVYEFSLDDVIEMLTLRELIEPRVAEMAMEVNATRIAESLEASIEKMRRAAERDERSEAAKAHTQFHGVFYLESQNRLFKRLWDELAPMFRLNLVVFQTTFHSLSDLPHQHAHITNAASSGDLARLDDAIRNHFYMGEKRLVTELLGMRRQVMSSQEDPHEA